ncbi:MAG: inorganic diphosphatase [Clostridia bacterium]|nr:inorganic diphosphatase [Clostridia bacterium]
MNIWHDIDKSRILPERFTAVIEISKGGKNKYELDKSTGMLKLDRVLYTSTHYPANYGFIPRTLAEDGDPLDVLVLCQEALIPMTLVECKPIGVLEMKDADALDQKIIAVPIQDPSYNTYESIHQIPAHIFAELSNFFEVYKTLEGVHTEVTGISGVFDALRVIQNSIDMYRATFLPNDPA